MLTNRVGILRGVPPPEYEAKFDALRPAQAKFRPSSQSYASRC
jgi:hypothetical protein